MAIITEQDFIDLLEIGLKPIPLKWDIDTKTVKSHCIAHSEITADNYSIDNFKTIVKSLQGVNGIGIKLFSPFACIDFDLKNTEDKDVFDKYLKSASHQDSDILSKICIERTRNAGYHVYIKYKGLKNKVSLAREKNGDEVIAIYTGGTLSYCDPTPGYEMYHNEWQDLEELTDDQFDILTSCAITFDKYESKNGGASKTILTAYPKEHESTCIQFDEGITDEAFDLMLNEINLFYNPDYKNKKGDYFTAYLRKGSKTQMSAKVYFKSKKVLIFSGSIQGYPYFADRIDADDHSWVLTPSKLIYYKNDQDWSTTMEEINMIADSIGLELIKSIENKLVVKQNNTKLDNFWKQKNVMEGVVFLGVFNFRVKKNEKTLELTILLQGLEKHEIYELVCLLGYYKRYLPGSNNYLFIKSIDNVIEEVTIQKIRDHVFSFTLDKIKNGLSFSIGGEQFNYSYEILSNTYLNQQDQIFNKNFLEILPTFDVLELRDERELSYFPFNNAIIKVTKDDILKLDYSELPKIERCVWRTHIVNRDFNLGDFPEGEYEKFFKNVSGKNLDVFKAAAGYLIHSHNEDHLTKAIVAYDEKMQDEENPQGGTGKGLFFKALSFIRETVAIDGKRFDPYDRFSFQNINVSTQIVSIDDLSRKVSFDNFFSVITNGVQVERKNQNKIILKIEDSPKWYFSSNTVIESVSPSYSRRIYILEFTDYYSSKIISGCENPVLDEHGILFDKIKWSQNDWDAFTMFLFKCLQFYFKKGLISHSLSNVKSNIMKQKFGPEFLEWYENNRLELNRPTPIAPLYESYLAATGYSRNDFKQRLFTEQLKRYAKDNSMRCEIVATNGVSRIELMENK